MLIKKLRGACATLSVAHTKPRVAPPCAGAARLAGVIAPQPNLDRTRSGAGGARIAACALGGPHRRMWPPQSASRERLGSVGPGVPGPRTSPHYKRPADNRARRVDLDLRAFRHHQRSAGREVGRKLPDQAAFLDQGVPLDVEPVRHMPQIAAPAQDQVALRSSLPMAASSACPPPTALKVPFTYSVRASGSMPSDTVTSPSNSIWSRWN